MRIHLIPKITIKNRLLCGYLLCAVTTAIAVGVAILSLRQIRSDLQIMTSKIAININEQNQQDLRMRVVQVFLEDINNAKSEENLKIAKAKFDKIEFAAQDKIRQTFQDFIMIKAKQIQISEDLASFYADTEATLKNVKSMTEALSTVEATLKVNNYGGLLNAVVKDALLCDKDSAIIDSIQTEINILLKKATNELDLLPKNEITNDISKSLNKLGISTKNMLYNKKQMLDVNYELETILVKLADQRQAMYKNLLNKSESLKYDTEKILHSTNAMIVKKQSLLLLLGLLSVFFAITIGIFISNFITRPLKRAVEISKAIAEGNLNQKENIISLDEISDDETGQLLQAMTNMTQKLNSLLGQVQKSTVQLMSSSNEIAATSREQEVTMQEFGASTKDVANSAKNIYQTSNDLVSTMNEITTMAEETATSAGNGHQSLLNMATTIDQMDQASQSISVKLAAINEKAENVTNVVTTITKVADQTNLLSLNAAIEAEKAGEYGLGFSVVATEIRRLADQTAVATLDIAQMVKEMQLAVSAGVMEMDKFAKEVHQGVEEVNLISAQLIQIIEKVQALTPNFEAVNQGMNSQSQRAHQISESMVQLGEGADQTIVSLSEFNMATQNLNKAARDLQNEMSHFKVSS